MKSSTQRRFTCFSITQSSLPPSFVSRPNVLLLPPFLLLRVPRRPRRKRTNRRTCSRRHAQWRCKTRSALSLHPNTQLLTSSLHSIVLNISFSSFPRRRRCSRFCIPRFTSSHRHLCSPRLLPGKGQLPCCQGTSLPLPLFHPSHVTHPSTVQK